MNANYQRLSIKAAATIFFIFVVIIILVRTQTSFDDDAPELHTDFSPQNQPSQAAPTFAPFEDSIDPIQPDLPTLAKKQPAPTSPNPPIPQLDPFPQELPDPALPNLNPYIPSVVREPDLSEPQNKTSRKNRWMAQVSSEEEAKIDAIIDEAEQRHIKTVTNNIDRRTAIATVNRITRPCFEELATRAPEATGHVIVNFDIIGQKSGRGVFENVHIVTNYNLRDMAFEGCIISTIQTATFESIATDRIWVEHGIKTL